MPTAVVWPMPRVRELVDGFVGQRARAGNDAHRALAEDLAGHDADLAFLRRDDARAVGADEPLLVAAQVVP